MLFGGLREREASQSGDDGSSDIALALAARSDPLALTQLYERYFNAIYAYCYVRLNDREAAEDATSEVFLKLVASLPQYRGGVFAAWIYRIAHNVVIDVARRHRAQPVALPETLPAPGPDPENVALANAEQRELKAALAQLPDEQRIVLELGCADWPVHRIADALGKSSAAISMLRLRAIHRLREIMTNRGKQR